MLPVEHPRQRLRRDVERIADRSCLERYGPAVGRVQPGPVNHFLPESSILIVKDRGYFICVPTRRQGPRGGCVGMAFQKPAFDEEADADAGVGASSRSSPGSPPSTILEGSKMAHEPAACRLIPA